MLKRVLAALVASLLITLGLASPAQATTYHHNVPGGVSTTALTYFYGSAKQNFTGTLPTGIFADITARNLTRTGTDFHTLMELATIQNDAGGRQIAEIGFAVNPGVFGDNNAHLFGGRWVNSTFGGWNSGGWVDKAANATNLGATLTDGTTYRFGMRYDGANCGAAPNGWWLWLGTPAGVGDWVGCFADTEWTGAGATFVSGDELQGFGEVAADTSTPCTNMGMNPPPQTITTSSGATIGGIDAISVTNENFNSYIVTNSSYYNALIDSGETPGSVNTVRIGGGGSC